MSPGRLRHLASGQHSSHLGLPVTPLESGDPRRRTTFFEHLLNPKMTGGRGRHLRQVRHYQNLVVRCEVGQ